jgi:predicted metal-dependent hydrolase
MRYAESFPLPPYRHVPGRTRHPVSDPGGHAFVGVSFTEPPIDLDRWADSAAYCYAIDLFNHGFYWEAHEVWEGLWRDLGRVGLGADFLKGLIKLAAALVKAREGRREGVRRHARRAGQLFAAVRADRRAAAHGDRIGGLAFDDLCALSDRLARDASSISLEEPPHSDGLLADWTATYRLAPN